VLPGVSGKIGDLCLSCLAADPDDRPTAATAAAVVQVALAVRPPERGAVVRPSSRDELETQSVSLRASGDAERRLRRRRTLVLVACLLAVLGASAFAFNKFRGDDSTAAAAPGPTTTTTAGGPPVGTELPVQPSVPTTHLPGTVPDPVAPKEEVVKGVPGPVVTVVVTSPGNPQTPLPVVGPATSFRTPGGTAIVVCDSLGPRVTSVVAEPGYYPNQVGLIVVAYVFFTKPSDTAGPGMTYRLTLKCSAPGAEPSATVASYVGEQMVTPSPTS
jgi:serine/threonine-protein kinase